MEPQTLLLSYNLNNIDAAVRKFWAALDKQAVFAFSGEMGAGKTTFIHKLCDYLQVEDTVSSPTFALINEYHFRDTAGIDKVIYHLDWYRLRDTDEAIAAGMEDCLLQAKNGGAYCFVEWPEKAPKLLLPPYVWISIQTMPDILEREMAVSIIRSQE